MPNSVNEYFTVIIPSCRFNYRYNNINSNQIQIANRTIGLSVIQFGDTPNSITMY